MTNMHEILKNYLNDEQLERIESTRIFIAGCGGLGSNIAHMLVRCGFMHFTLLDFDVVEARNLNRQFFFPDQIGMKKTKALSQNLIRLNPDLKITMIETRLEETGKVPCLTDGSDILIEAFDDPASKAIFVSGAISTGNPVISASGIGGYGSIDEITVKNPFPNLYLVGDGSRDTDSYPPLSPRVNAAAAIQADIALELALS